MKSTGIYDRAKNEGFRLLLQKMLNTMLDRESSKQLGAKRMSAQRYALTAVMRAHTRAEEPG